MSLTSLRPVATIVVGIVDLNGGKGWEAGRNASEGGVNTSNGGCFCSGAGEVYGNFVSVEDVEAGTEFPVFNNVNAGEKVDAGDVVVFGTVLRIDVVATANVAESIVVVNSTSSYRHVVVLVIAGVVPDVFGNGNENIEAAAVVDGVAVIDLKRVLLCYRKQSR